MPVLLGVAGSVGNSNGLIPGTISSLDPTKCTVDGASTPILVLTGHPYGPRVGDRVGLQQIGRQYVAFPLDVSSTASYPGNRIRFFGDTTAPRLNTQLLPYSEFSDASDSWAWPGFYLDEAEIVHCLGLAQEVTAASFTGSLYQLPPAYRPARELLFFGVNNNGLAHLKVGTDGIITATTPGNLAASTFINLDEIHFPSETIQTIPWIDITSGLQSGFSNYDAAHSVRGWIDNVGDLHLQGWVKASSAALTGNFLQLPASLWAGTASGTNLMAVPTLDTQGTYARIDISTAGMLSMTTYISGATGTAGFSLDGIVIPLAAQQDAVVWKSSPYANSWAPFSVSPGFDGLRIYRNPIGRVYTKGLLKSGTLGLTIGPVFDAAWLRPQRNVMASVWAGPGGARLDVLGATNALSSLQVTNYYNSGSNAFVSLLGMQWDAIPR